MHDLTAIASSAPEPPKQGDFAAFVAQLEKDPEERAALEQARADLRKRLEDESDA